MRNTWSRLSCALLCIMIILTCLEGFALADYSGKWGKLSWTLDSNGKLTISGSGDMDDFHTPTLENLKYEAWLAYRGKIEEVVIQDGITSIGSKAFEFCNLKMVTIPDSVISIGEEAFYYCHALSSITIPDSVTTIGSEAFCHCDALSSITIPDSVTTIGFQAFGLC